MDLSFSVHTLAKFSSNPGKVHFEGLVHLLRYIRENNTRGYFTPKQISISRELLNLAVRFLKEGVAPSVLTNLDKVLLISSDLIKNVFLVHTHTQLLAKRHGPAWSIRGQILFFHPFSMLSPSQDPHRPKKIEK